MRTTAFGCTLLSHLPRRRALIGVAEAADDCERPHRGVRGTLEEITEIVPEEIYQLTLVLRHAQEGSHAVQAPNGKLVLQADVCVSQYLAR